MSFETIADRGLVGTTAMRGSYKAPNNSMQRTALRAVVEPEREGADRWPTPRMTRPSVLLGEKAALPLSGRNVATA